MSPFHSPSSFPSAVPLSIPFCSLTDSHLSPLTPSQPHCLPILLQLCDQLIALLHDIVVLFVLIIRTVRLDNTLSGHAVNRAGDAVRGDEFCEVTERV